MPQDTENAIHKDPASVQSDRRACADDDISGLDPVSAREYIAQYITTLKLQEKESETSAADLSLWESRATLARSRGMEELALQAEKEASLIRSRKSALDADIETLKLQIEKMKKQLSLLASRARSVDPDVLEQELLMAAGHLPGDEEKAALERDLKTLEKEASADAALAALKMKMGKDS
ncbi:MAG: chromosome partitioning protein [Treponema sp.]|jgi:phage shock protein A|nr:chromosome partitioning protein [Treponema sp.]